MKKLTSIILAIAALGLCNVNAQTTTAPATPTTPADVISGIGDYFSSVNTNLSWDATPFSLWTGVNYQSGVNTSAEIGASYDLWKPTASATATTKLAIAPEVTLRNAGIAGTIVSGQGGIGLSIEHYDLKLTGYLDGGYYLPANSPMFEIGGRVLKKITISTHAGVGLSFDHYFKQGNQNTPTVTTFVGWDF